MRCKNRKQNLPTSLIIYIIGIAAFSTGTVIGPSFHQAFLYLGYFGIVVMLGVSLHSFSQGFHQIQREFILLFLFIVWAVFTGLLMAVDYHSVFRSMERLLQSFTVAFCVAGASSRLRSPAIGLATLWGIAILLSSYGLVLGNFMHFMDLSSDGVGNVVGTRGVSMVQNANAMGVNAVWGFCAVIYFSQIKKKSPLLLFLMWITVPLLGITILASASRKALLLPVVFLTAWIWFCHKKDLNRQLYKILPIVALAGAIYMATPWIMENTFVGQRMQRSLDTENMDGSTAVRLLTYKQAAAIVVRYPVAGVGLGQWRFYGDTGYAHNEYGEVIATTGVVGFLLYFSAYVVVIRRLMRIHRYTNDRIEFFRSGLCLAIFVTIAAAGFGQVMFPSLPYWVLAGSIWGYAYGAEQRLIACHSTAIGNCRTRRKL
jgi:O-antigen ligase